MAKDTMESAVPFSFTRFFEGRTRAWGVFEDRRGRPRLRLEVDMRGRFEGDVFLLEEDFRYHDGRVEQRTWRVLPQPDGGFTATCPDCIGQAVGRVTDEGVEMRYRFLLRTKRRTLSVDLRERLYAMDERHVVNRASMSKWGVRLGELSLFFEKA